MQGTRLTPEKITSPFQLMAAWFSMLILLVSVLLTAANAITNPDWASGYLVVFASIVVLIVFACVTLMLTKFRPHLQEGKEYAQWLKDQNSYSSGYLSKEPARRPASKPAITAPHIRKATPVAPKRFLINVLDAAGAVNLVEALKGAAFTAEIYQEPHRVEQKMLPNVAQNEGIWIGSRLDPASVIEAINIAVAHWPELKYLHLSADGGDPPDFVHVQVFFGGATEAAHRYGLRAWSSEELMSLDQQMSTEKFHAAIRAKYS